MRAAILLASLPIPASAQGYDCTMTRACLDQRPCYDSTLKIRVGASEGQIARIEVGDRPARYARVERSGIWSSYIGTDDLGRIEVLDVGDDGDATFVATQPSAPPYTESRTGTCEEN